MSNPFNPKGYVVHPPAEPGGLWVATQRSPLPPLERTGRYEDADLGPRRDQLLVAEIDSSIAFLNVEFVVCTALLLFNFDALRQAPVAILALFTAMVFLLYGGLCFAVAGGQMARGAGGHDAVERSMEWGNILSEWFGMYQLILVLPIVVEVGAKSHWLGAAAVAVDIAGYTVYVGTRSDLLGRFLRGAVRLAIHATFMLALVATWAGVAIGCATVSWIGGAIFAGLAICCAIVHAKRGEYQEARS